MVGDSPIVVGISYHEFWSRELLAYIHDPNSIYNSGKKLKDMQA